jgi:hypothetical protein
MNLQKYPAVAAALQAGFANKRRVSVPVLDQVNFLEGPVRRTDLTD